DLDEPEILGFRRDEHVVGRARGKGEDRLTAIVHWRGAGIGPGANSRGDTAVYADPASRDVRGAVAVETDDFDNRLWLRWAGVDAGPPGRGEHVQAVERSVRALGVGRRDTSHCGDHRDNEQASRSHCPACIHSSVLLLTVNIRLTLLGPEARWDITA